MTDTKDTTESAIARRAPQSHQAIVRFALIVVIAFAGDLMLKWYAFANVTGTPISGEMLRELSDNAVPDHDSIVVIPTVLSLHLTVNHGAVFGIGAGGRWLFVVIAVVACAIIGRVFWVSRANDWVLHASLALITGGALGNLYDRFFFGVVRDMLLIFPETELPFGWEWPGGSSLVYPWIFNLADVALCVGIFVIIASMLFSKRADAPSTRLETKGKATS